MADWIQKATKEMDKKGTIGSFTKQAKRAKMSTEAFADEVLNNPSKFKEKTRKRAQFYKNMQKKYVKGGSMAKGGEIIEVKGFGKYQKIDGEIEIGDMAISENGMLNEYVDEDDDLYFINETHTKVIPIEEYAGGGEIGKKEWVKKFLSEQDEDGIKMTMENVWGDSDELWEMSKKQIISEVMKNEKGEIDNIYMNYYGYAKGGSMASGGEIEKVVNHNGEWKIYYGKSDWGNPMHLSTNRGDIHRDITFPTKQSAQKFLKSSDDEQGRYAHNFMVKVFKDEGWSVDSVSDSYSKGGSTYAEGGEVGKTYQIKGVEVLYHEDSYEQGELDHFHSYYLNSSEFPYETKFSNKKDLFKTLSEFVGYGTDYSENDFHVEEDENQIETDVLVKYKKDSDWDEFSEPSEADKNLWKKGKMKLYNAHFTFTYEVYKKEKMDFAKLSDDDKDGIRHFRF